MRIVLLGAPGVGKGTIASLLSKKYGLPHISTGDIFKGAIRKGDELGLRVKSIVESGNLVPDELVNQVVRKRLLQEDASKGFFLDGYPRTVEQANAMDKFSKPDAILNLNADRKTIIKRLSGRRVCTGCGAIYHIRYSQPKKEGICDSCKGKLIKRKDDDESVIANRLDVYENQTKPLIEFYNKRKSYFEIDSNYEMEDIDRITKQCEDALSKVK
ncbi:adenylate kinase [Candidatus Woesearchaeota archaeon]|nr:adenylate kinase [Candidatus Woesearchaeota archaeon]